MSTIYLILLITTFVLGFVATVLQPITVVLDACFWPVADLSHERGDVHFREMTRPRACWLPRAAFDPLQKIHELRWAVLGTSEFASALLFL